MPKKAAAPAVGMRSIASFFGAAPKPSAPAGVAGLGNDQAPELKSMPMESPQALGPRTPGRASSEKTSKKDKADDSFPGSPDSCGTPADGTAEVSPPKGQKLAERLGGGASSEPTRLPQAADGALAPAADEAIASACSPPAGNRSVRPGRRAAAANKGKKYVLDSSDSSDGDDDGEDGEGRTKTATGGKTAGNSRKRIRAISDSDESEFIAEEESDAADEDMAESDASLEESENEAPKKKASTARLSKPAAKMAKTKSTGHAQTVGVSPSPARPASKPVAVGAAATAPRFNDKAPDQQRREQRVSEFEKKNEGRYAWLLDQRDAKQRKPTDKDFDKRTLYIPKAAYSKFSQFEKQFWDIKKDYFDVVLFFKKGKFYEMFEGDADVGHRHLHLKLTDRVNMRMCGIPEGQFSAYAVKLVALGFKVGRVEQMETMNAMQKRAAKDKVKAAATVCERELCEVLTQGTVSDESMLEGPQANFLLTICRGGRAADEYGVCLLEASTGVFYTGQFVDDDQLTQFETLLLRAKPREVVFPKGGLESAAIKLIKRHLNNPLLNALDPDEQFWDAEKSEWELNATGYFAYADADTSQHTRIEQWPEVLRNAHKDGSKLALSAVGGCVSYLRSLKLDEELVSLKNFRPLCDFEGESVSSLVIDGQTLCNLEILENSNGTTEGTLLKHLDRCSTAFGKRMFRTWVCAPLRDVIAIRARLDAAEHLAADTDARKALSKILRQIPDVERKLSRVHMQGSGRKQGVMFDDTGARKLRAFLQLLDAMDTLCNVRDALEKHSLLGADANVVLPHVDFPQDARERLDHFKAGYGDLQQAMEVGFITPKRGVDDEYDAAHDRLVAIEKGLNDELNAWKKELGISLSFWSASTGKEPYQIEIPVSYVEAKGRKLPDALELKSQTAKVRRYWTPGIKKLVLERVDARETLDALRQDMARRMQIDFDSHYSLWAQAVTSVAHLDCLLSLSYTCEEDGGGPVCRPQLLDEKGVGGTSRLGDVGAELELLESRHPCLAGGEGGAFVHNDIRLGSRHNEGAEEIDENAATEARACVVTGPNMGGKSTLLRQACVAVIMAQIGAWVPARECRLRCVDRIFTRIGASDRIMSGQSTFMVELTETSTILRHASARSLVVLDELGRGTSTHDGYAIAHAVLAHLVSSVRPLLLFSTHYHTLTDELRGSKEVSLYHMNCIVDEAARHVTFLYKFTRGVATDSYGLHCAQAAGLPPAVVSRAAERKRDLETAGGGLREMSRLALFKSLTRFGAESMSDVDMNELMSMRRQVRLALGGTD